MEPGIDYDEVVTMVIPKGMFTVRGKMDFDDNSAIDYTTVARVK